MTTSIPTIAILLTCFNRRATTLACLAAIPDAVAGSCNYKIILVDDGCTDGTGEAVAEAYPAAQIIHSKGNLYWNKGMRLAWQAAIPLKPDFYLWLNDDTQLHTNAISGLLSTYHAAASPRTIVVGYTVDPETGALTYGGCRRSATKISRLHYIHLPAGPGECDTVNGNCVLFPASAVTDIGINAEYYSHAFGDIDYGLRAARAGYKIVQHATPVAIQERNDKYTASVSTLTLKNWRFILTHPKGVPVREWFIFCRTYGGILWPANFLYRYIKMIRAGL